MTSIIPTPRCPITIRLAIPSDSGFIDGLQKANTYRVGFLPGKQLEDHIDKQAVLVAEENATTDCADYTDLNSLSAESVKSAVPTPVGYIIAKDRYMRRDDLGVIYQL